MLRVQAWLVFLGWMMVVSAASEAPDLAGLHPLKSGPVFEAIGATPRPGQRANAPAVPERAPAALTTRDSSRLDGFAAGVSA
jgi:hypothetical protein